MCNFLQECYTQHNKTPLTPVQMENKRQNLQQMAEKLAFGGKYDIWCHIEVPGRRQRDVSSQRVGEEQDGGREK